MTASRAFTRAPSPAQIRRAAALAIRNRARAIHPVTMPHPDLAPEPEPTPMLRAPEAGETPLSQEEIAVGVRHGHIRTARVRAFAEGAH
jgi:hypothetical protein